MDRLEELALISKVIRELQAHLGTEGDTKTLAEFVIDIYDRVNKSSSKTIDVSSFKKILNRSYGNFDDRLINSLFTVISKQRSPFRPDVDGMSSGRTESKISEKPLASSTINSKNCPPRMVHDYYRHQEFPIDIDRSRFSSRDTTSHVIQPFGNDYTSRPVRSISSHQKSELINYPRSFPSRNLNLGKPSGPIVSLREKKPKRRLTSPERFELKQLVAGGAISRDEYDRILANNEEESKVNRGDHHSHSYNSEEVYEVELRPMEASFMRGHLKDALKQASPVRVILDPEGSLNRAALAAPILAHERRSLTAAKEAKDNVNSSKVLADSKLNPYQVRALKRREESKNLSSTTLAYDLMKNSDRMEQKRIVYNAVNQSWNDPKKTEEESLLFAEDVKRARMPNREIPEWKRVALGEEEYSPESHDSKEFKQHSSLNNLHNQRKNLENFNRNVHHQDRFSINYEKPQDVSYSRKMILEQKAQLPITKLRRELIEAIDAHDVLVVIGETGSGKTTQMVQYLVEEGYCDHSRGAFVKTDSESKNSDFIHKQLSNNLSIDLVGKKKGNIINENSNATSRKFMIACTQPRRVAATSVSKRVAEEMGVVLGEAVGYTIRFEDCTTPGKTLIKYMTDGMLLRECLTDPLLMAYSVVILDEAHERTVNTDVLFGLLREAMKKRKAISPLNALKLIVTSATLEAEKFSSYYGGCPIFRIPGRTFPVEILFTQEPEPDYLDATLVTAMQIHLSEPPGDILIFLTGQEEIECACEVLYERVKALGSTIPPLLVLPLYAAMAAELQQRVFQPAPHLTRKVILATNIAETSLTIDGIFYVIDPGFCKQKAFNPKLGLDQLLVTPVSQAQARQRAGRAGRTGPGKCFRLYTETAYEEEMLPTSIPELQRTNLANTILTLKAMGITEPLEFPFMDAPPIDSMLAAMENLYALGALDTDGFLTRMGRRMAELPLEPPLAKMLLYGAEQGVSGDVAAVVALLSVQNIFLRPRDRQAQADSRKSRLNHSDGDHMTLLNVYDTWLRNSCSPAWCSENFVQLRSLRRAQEVRKQLLSIVSRFEDLGPRNSPAQFTANRGFDVSSGRSMYGVNKRDKTNFYGENYEMEPSKRSELVRMSVCAGFFHHSARKDSSNGGGSGSHDSGATTYKMLTDGQSVSIHPSSALFQAGGAPEWLVFHELVMTSKEYMREVSVIDPRWLPKVAPAFFHHPDPKLGNLSARKLAEKIKPLHNRFEDPDEWRLSKRTVSKRSR